MRSQVHIKNFAGALDWTQVERVLVSAARRFGMVDTTVPITVSFQADRNPFLTSSRSSQAASSFDHNLSHEQYVSASDSRDIFVAYPDFDPTAEPERQTLLSENEVVERMYVNGEDESEALGKIDLKDFFSESEIADSRRPTAAPQVSHVDEVAAADSDVADSDVIDDSPIAVNGVPAVASTQLLNSATREEKQAEVAAQVISPLPIQKSTAMPQTQDHAFTVPAEATTEVTAPPTVVQPIDPVQTVQVSKQSHVPITPTPDRKLVKIIAILIFLILLFSALIVSGFRLRDLFSKPQPQASLLVTARPTPSLMRLDQSPQAPLGMLYIPDGVFRMGREDGDAYEAPVHEITIAPFFIDRTEVTNAQYAEFLKATNHRSPPDWKSRQYAVSTEKFPVVKVSWQDANEYAAWAGKRLPTEAEWEYAARAKEGRTYPWGSNWDVTKANTSESNLNHPVEVGSYANAANPLGLLDMAGNVWEWTAGEVTSYKDSGITLAPGKVIRGGAFYTPKERATTTYRGFAPADKKAPGIGFRCVKNLP